MTGLKIFHHKFGLPLDRIFQTTALNYYRRSDLSQSEQALVAQCVADLEVIIEQEGPDTIAAFIGEQALGTGGLVPPPKGYWPAIQAVLEKYDKLLIADVVVTGYGRLCSMFGREYYGMKPDLITIAKGLMSADAPLFESMGSKRMWKVLENGTQEFGPFGHSWTYYTPRIGAAAGVANLNLLEDLKLI